MSASIWSPNQTPIPSFLDRYINWAPIYGIVSGQLFRYEDLHEAVAGLGTTITDLVVRKNTTLNQNLSIPTNLTLRVENSAIINLNGFSLTLNSKPNLPEQQCFTTTGSVVFANFSRPNLIIPEWWGAVGNNVADDTAALQAWLTVAGNLHLPDKSYRISAQLLGASYTTITGVSRDTSLIYYAGTTTIPGGAMLKFPTKSAIVIDKIGFRCVEGVVGNATKQLHFENCVYYEVANTSFGVLSSASGTCQIQPCVADQTTSGFVPPRGNSSFRNILAVVEPGDAGTASTSAIYIKGHPLQPQNNVVFSGEGNLEHFGFGIKLELAANCEIGTWQLRGATQAEICLINSSATTIVGTNIIPTNGTGKGITIDSNCLDTLIANAAFNISSGLPAAAIEDFGSRTTIIGQGAPGALAFPGKLPGAWELLKPDGIGPNIKITRTATDTGQGGIHMLRAGSSMLANTWFGIAAGAGVGGQDLQRFEVAGALREKLDSNGQRCLYVPNGNPGAGVLGNSQLLFYVSQGTNQLIALCKYSDGTVKSATFTLV